MQFQTLAHCTIEEIVECLLLGFKNYFVPMPDSVVYWENRFKAARVDWRLSAGAFVGNKLVGFVIHGIDEFEGNLTAFNTGTCVIEAYRGLKVVDQLYQFILDDLRANHVSICLLEVIQENHIAVRVYERIGFEIIKSYHCFKGQLREKISGNSIKSRISAPFQLIPPRHDSWDNCQAGITLNEAPIIHYGFEKNGTQIGYISIDESNGVIYQIEKLDQADWGDIFCHFQGQLIKYNNIPEERTDLIEALLSFDVERPIMQYLMKWTLNQA